MYFLFIFLFIINFLSVSPNTDIVFSDFDDVVKENSGEIFHSSKSSKLLNNLTENPDIDSAIENLSKSLVEAIVSKLEVQDKITKLTISALSARQQPKIFSAIEKRRILDQISRSLSSEILRETRKSCEPALHRLVYGLGQIAAELSIVAAVKDATYSKSLYKLETGDFPVRRKRSILLTDNIEAEGVNIDNKLADSIPSSEKTPIVPFSEQVAQKTDNELNANIEKSAPNTVAVTKNDNEDLWNSFLPAAATVKQVAQKTDNELNANIEKSAPNTMVVTKNDNKDLWNPFLPTAPVEQVAQKTDNELNANIEKTAPNTVAVTKDDNEDLWNPFLPAAPVIKETAVEKKPFLNKTALELEGKIDYRGFNINASSVINATAIGEIHPHSHYMRIIKKDLSETARKLKQMEMLELKAKKSILFSGEVAFLTAASVISMRRALVQADEVELAVKYSRIGINGVHNSQVLMTNLAKTAARQVAKDAKRASVKAASCEKAKKLALRYSDESMGSELDQIASRIATDTLPLVNLAKSMAYVSSQLAVNSMHLILDEIEDMKK